MPFFYGWWVAVACGIGLGCGLASVITATFPIFLAPLRAEFGWTQPQLFGALALTTLTVTILAPFFGSVVDRIGARRMILVGLLLEALVLASFAAQTASLPLFYLRYIALAVLAIGTTHVAFTRVITLWFDRRRGMALGITLAGLGVGSMVWPVLAQWAIDTYGWREAYLVLAGTIAVVGLSSVAFVVRDSPHSMGFRADGALSESATGPVEAPLVGMTTREAVRTPTFRLMLMAFIFIGASISSVQVHMVPLLTARGVSPMLAATAMSVLAGAMVIGRLGAGWLMDRFFAPRVAIAFLFGPIVAIVMLAAGASGALAFVAGILTGLAVGAEVDVTAYLASRYFGLRNFSGIYAFFYGAYALGAAFGPLITAVFVAQTGGYTEILTVHAVLLVMGGVLLMRLPRFPQWQ